MENRKEEYPFIKFAADHIFWGFVIGVVYNLILFRQIDGFDVTNSNYILTEILVVVSLIGAGVEIDLDYNIVRVFLSLVTGFGVYTWVSYYDQMMPFCVGILFVMGLLILLYSVYMLSSKNKSKLKFWDVFWLRTMKIFHVSRYIMCFSAVIVIVVSMLGLLFGWASKSEITQPVEDLNIGNYEECLENNIDELAKLDEPVWETLNTDEKIEVIQTLAEVEKSYLGLAVKLKISVEPAQTTERMGYYLKSGEKIVISKHSIENNSSWVIVNTLCHEIYHAYEDKLIDLYIKAEPSEKKLDIFSDARNYYREYKNYISPEDNYSGYYNQATEADAREHAKQATINYYRYIKNHLR